MPATRTAALIFAATAVLIALLTYLGVMTVALFAGLMLVFNSAFLVVMSNLVSLVIDPQNMIALLINGSP
jgi:hypothetical protein